MDEEGIEHLNQALAIAFDEQDITGQAHILNALDMAIARTADPVRGLDYAQESLQPFRILEQPVWVARKLNSVGWHATLLGLPEQALAACTEALAITREHGDRENEAATLDSLGAVAAATGDHRRALAHHQEVLAVSADIGADHQIEQVLDHLGTTYLGLGEPERAREQWREALRLYRSHYRYSKADQVEAQLATLDKQSPPTLATLHNLTGE